ncbi:MAG: hypothetical protein ABFD49_08605 [Armatimonadota bacterium]|nr:hypothetical protein [bacterium]
MRSALPCHIGYIGLGSAIACDALRALASVAGCAESFWASVSRSYDTGHIHHAAAQLRRNAHLCIHSATDYMSWLADKGYCREDIRQIRYVVEVFCGLEPVFAIVTSLVNRWLSEAYFDASVRTAYSSSYSCASAPFYSGDIRFLNECDDLACVESLSGRHGEPVHAFFRALAVWPEFARTACGEVSGMERFYDASRNIRQEVEALSAGVPMRPCERPSDINTDALRLIISRCGIVSADVITAAAILRNGFIFGEESQRNACGMREGGDRAQ